MREALRIDRRTGFSGGIFQDRTRPPECGAPWHAGMAYSLGYMPAAMQGVEREAGAGSSSR